MGTKLYETETTEFQLRAVKLQSFEQVTWRSDSKLVTPHLDLRLVTQDSDSRLGTQDLG